MLEIVKDYFAWIVAVLYVCLIIAMLMWRNAKANHGWHAFSVLMLVAAIVVMIIGATLHANTKQVCDRMSMDHATVTVDQTPAAFHGMWVKVCKEK